ncbi:MAG: hypothetical protein HRU19_20615 [Pseudobacteriovorax sp.]|nr:hypothetical protein [Pseudobacteriovorax sp.]
MDFKSEKTHYLGLFYDILNRLVEDYRLQAKANLSISRLSLMAGFSSRNYLGDILNRNRFPSESALQKIFSVVQTDPNSKDLLILIHRFCSFKSDCPSAKTLLKKLQVFRKSDDIVNLEGGALPFVKEYLPLVLAAIGTTSRGSSLSDIVSRSGFQRSTVQTALKELCDLNLVREDDNGFHLHQTHMIFERLGSTEGFLQYYLYGLERSHRKAKLGFTDKNMLFLQSNFTVSQRNVPKLREALKQTLLSFIDEETEDSGDTLVHLNLSFFSLK